MAKQVYYWDSSALIKRYIREIGSSTVLSIEVASASFTATLSHAEILATFYRLRREGRISQTEVSKLLAAFSDDWRRMLLVDYQEEIRLIAEKAIAKSPLKGADLVHLSAALKLVDEGLDVILLTFDRQLQKAAEDHGLKVN